MKESKILPFASFNYLQKNKISLTLIVQEVERTTPFFDWINKDFCNKGENNVYQHFLFFPHFKCSPLQGYCRVTETWDVLVKGELY